MEVGVERSRLRLLSRIVIVVITLCLIATLFYFSEKERIAKINNNIAAWKTETIITPEAGSLQAAGYITISWKSADTMGSVKGYKIYVNDEFVAETNAQTTSYEYYTTSVSGHRVYIEADLRRGSVINSDIQTFYVNKKGHCVNKDMAQNIDAKEWGCSWYYNWELNPFMYDSFKELQYVPMMWKSCDTDQKIISRFHKQGYKYVLAFNEPDLVEQSDIAVEDAVEGMKAFMNQNILVGAPATALCPPWSRNWFQPFMNQMKYEGMDVDFIPIHHYWNWSQPEAVDAFLDLVKETYEMYKKPIWITEFAISSNPGDTKAQRQLVMDYMKPVIEALDELEYVERYAWFSFSPNDRRNGGSSLIQEYTGEITDLGYMYQKLGMPEGYNDSNVINRVENSRKDVIK